MMIMDKLTSIASKRLALSSRCDSFVLKIAVGYLLLPYFLFFWGWLRLPYAILFISALIISYWRLIKQIDREYRVKEEFSISWLIIIVSVVLITVWLLYSGVGHFSDQVGDYKKHNLILTHLINQKWPIIEKLTDKNAYILVYYLAYYLPAGLIGKVFGFDIANVFQFFFTLFGVLLTVYFLFSFGGYRKLLSVVVIFLLFSGMDVLGGYILKGQFPPLNEAWSPPFVYQGTTVTIYFSPQQAIPGWLSTLLIIWLLKKGDGYKYFGFVWALTLLWAPWISIGLIPLLLFIILKHLKNLRQMFSFINIVPTLIIGVVCYQYYNTNQSSIRNNFWVWSTSPTWLPDYLVFILVEFLVLLLVLLILIWKQNTYRELLFLCAGTLVIIPLYHSGVFNDFCMRASIPSLTILFLTTIVAVMNFTDEKDTSNKKYSYKLLIIMIIIGSAMSIAQISSSFSRTNQIYGGLFYKYSVSYEPNLFKSFNDIPSDVILEQYLARNVDFRKYQWLFKY